MATDGAGVTATGRSRVFVEFSERSDQQLVVDWLDARGGYEVMLDPKTAPPPDVCLLDGPSLVERRETVAAFRSEADPVYVPVLLALEEDTDETAALAEFTDGDTTVVDDTVRMPVEKGVLERRLEALLNVRHATVRLSERERQYRGLLRLVPEAILLVRDETVLYGNDAAAGLLGVGDADELADRPLSALVDVDEGVADLLATVADGDRVEEFRPAMMTVDGDSIETEVAGVRVTYGGAPATQLLVRDVTERRRRREQLNLYGRAIEAANQGITIADARQPDEPLVYANPAFQRITGYPVEQVLGRNCRFLQGDSTDPSRAARIREGIEERTPVSVELLNYRKDGTPFWNQLDVVPVRDAEGTVTHFLGLQRDVTAEKRREERLEVLDRVLRHNLRNRMTVIRGYAEKLAAADQETADHVLEATDDLLALTDGIRKFRDVVTTREGEPDARDVARMVREAAEAARAEHPAAALRLRCPETAVARAHGTLGLALGELFDLAMAGDDAELAVDVDAAEQGVTVRVTDLAGTVPDEELVVATTGTESPLEHAQGLGGWFVRWAVDSSGGELSVTETDHGTRMEIRLLAPPEE